MGEDDFIQSKLSRRSFLKATAAATAVAGLATTPGTLKALTAGGAVDANNTAASAGEQIFQCYDRGNCGGSCTINVHVRQGKVVKTSKIKRDIPADECICVKGLTHVQRIYNADRLKYPMRRVGERGAGKWERITWDEAISEITEKWKGYIQKYGPSSIVESKAFGSLAVDCDYPTRLFNVMGATNMACGYDMNLNTAGFQTFGMDIYGFGTSYEQMLKSKYIFVWGSNPTEAAMTFYDRLKRAKEAGAKIIVIDPNKTGIAMKADIFVPIRPGTDGALAQAMMNIAVAEGKIDKETIAKGTVGPFLVKESDGRFLRLSDIGKATAGSPEDAIVVRDASGQVGTQDEIKSPVINGSFTIEGVKVTTAYDLLLAKSAEWTPEKASEVCDIPVDKIYELAHMYAEGPTVLYSGYAIDHWGNGYLSMICMFALVLVTGQIGKEGAGICGVAGFFWGNGVINNAAVVYPPETKPRTTIPAKTMMDVINTGKFSGQDYPIKSMYIYIHNLLGNGVDRQGWIKALEKVELVVVADTIMSDTTMYADIVLPVPHFFEVETIGYIISEYNSYSEKAMDPAFETKGDIEIANLLGQAMGYGDLFTMTRQEFLAECLNNPVAKSMGLTFERFKKDKYVNITKTMPVINRGSDYKYPGTATGKAHFYYEPAPNTPVEARKYVVPGWEPPLEAWHENPLFKKYPLTYLSQRAKFKGHSQFTRSQWLLEIIPEPTLKMNPDDAKARDIKDGDTIKAFNDRGYVVLKAQVSAALRPGVTLIDHGWQYDQFIDGHYSDLTSNANNPLLYPAAAWFDTLIEVKKM